MRRVTLDFSGIALRYELHLALKKAFGFPEYYGMNLDALHDCLTDMNDTQLVITDCAAASGQMEKWPGFLSVFFDSAEENPGLDIRLMP